MEIIFLIFLFIIFYTWFVYPTLLFIIPKRAMKKGVSGEYCPYVTVLIAVHNEEEVVGKRISNILETDYPKELFEVLVVSDGSGDSTDRIVEEMAEKDERIKLIKADRGGKSAAQNMAIAYARGEIVVITDAGTIFEKDTIKKLIERFADERVGCVSGRLVLTSTDGNIAEGQGIYWRYEMLLRALESKAGLMHTASGAVMAVRKNIFRPFEDKYGDDCVIPLDVIADGYMVVHEEGAVAYDEFLTTIKGELKVRSRMTLRNLTGTFSRLGLLNPLRHPLISFSIISHKIFRWFTPFFMIVVFVTNLFLFGTQTIYTAIFYAQIFVYLMGLLGYIADRKERHIFFASQVFGFLVANMGFFLGVLKSLLGYSTTSYNKTQ